MWWSQHGVLTVGQKQEIAELKFKRLLREVVIEGKNRKNYMEEYMSLFLKTTNLLALNGGLKSVLTETNKLLNTVMVDAGLNVADHHDHFNNSWFSMNIVTVLEYKKPGFFTLMRPKQKGAVADTYYDIDSNDITNARIKEIGCLLHECFFKFCNDSFWSETSSVGAYARKHKARGSSLKSAPGKKC